VHGVENTHCVDHLCRYAFGVSKRIWLGQLRIYVFSFCISIFFNNTPLVALLIPPLRDWGRVLDVPPSQLLMPMDFAVLSGSLCSMIGTSTNLVVQGLVQQDRGYSFPFFAPIGIAFPVGIFCIIFMITIGQFLLPNRSGLLRVARDRAEDLIAEVQVEEGSRYVGKKLNIALGELGLPTSLVLKIRRRDKAFSPCSTPPSKVKPISRSPSVGNIVDAKYMKAAVKSWGKRKRTKTAKDSGAEQQHAGADQHEGAELQLDREPYRDILKPDPRDPIVAGDILFLTCAQEVVTKLAKSMKFQRKGLRILNSSVYDLAGYGTELVEVIVSHTNPFLGRRFAEVSGELSQTYGMGIVAIRSGASTGANTIKANAQLGGEKEGTPNLEDLAMLGSIRDSFHEMENKNSVHGGVPDPSIDDDDNEDGISDMVGLVLGWLGLAGLDLVVGLCFALPSLVFLSCLDSG
jgi:hypothetical protein